MPDFSELAVPTGWLVFTALLVAACFTDVRARRIPNRLVLLLFGAGLVFSLVNGPSAGTLLTLLGSTALGLVIWLPFYALRMLGAGDVKLFAAASAWLAPLAVVNAAVSSALIGGVLALFWFFRAHGAAFAMVRLSHAAQQPRILRDALPVASPAARVPYGVAMAAGLLATVLRPHFWL
jgi:prepilin peptidase CpaA